MIIDQKNLAQKQTKLYGYIFLIGGALFILFILLGSLSTQAKIENPYLYLVTLIIPIIFFEFGLYSITNADTMKVTTIRGQNIIDDAAISAFRVTKIYQGVRFLIALSILIPAFFIFAGYIIYSRGVNLGFQFYLTFGTILFYFLILRFLIYKLYKIINASKLRFLTNAIFWLSIIFFIFSLWITYSAIVNPQVLLSKVNTNYPTFFRFVFLGFGILFACVTLLMLHYIFNIGGLKYEIQNKNIVLYIPLNPLQTKKAIIPLSKIIKIYKVNNLELVSLQESYDKSTAGFTAMKDFLYDFIRDVRPYPRFYQYSTGGDVYYIKGTDFEYIVDIKDGDNLIKLLKKKYL